MFHVIEILKQRKGGLSANKINVILILRLEMLRKNN